MFKINLHKNKGFTHQNFLKKISGGFTIIETMISISIFLVVVMIGMGALLNANLIHKKSQDMRSIMDNLSFAMEDMSRNLRIGSNYVSTGTGISFTSADKENLGYDFRNEAIYKSTNTDPITPSDIKIDTGASSFTIVGTDANDKLQPMVTIKLVGKITYKGVETPFSLQTSVSQRLLDTPEETWVPS